MNVQIVMFPETRVAAIEHRGPPGLEHDTVRKLVAWKLEHKLLDPAKYHTKLGRVLSSDLLLSGSRYGPEY